LDPTVNAPVLWPLIVYFVAVLLLVGAMMLISYYMGERHSEKETGEPYESGITTTGSARIRLSAQFYLIAMFFVIFDLESAFVVAWAIAARQLGWAGYAEILVFIGFLLAALIYLWRLGALDWSTSSARQRRIRQKNSHQPEQ